jgi:diaminopimelate decarboxylase
VLYVKQGAEKTFVIVDAAMNDLVRPTLYEAYHEILPVREAKPGAKMVVADIVGPVCETGDYLALDRKLPVVQPGDLIAIMTAGAYGAVQASTYNTRPLVPEVLVRGKDAAIVRARIDAARQIGFDTLPGWLKA